MKIFDDMPTAERMRRNIRKLWPRRSKKFDGCERVSLHSHIPDWGADRAPIGYALLDPAGDHCLRRSHFEPPGSLPAWNDLRIRGLWEKLPVNVRWNIGCQLVKVWTGETPSCIRPFRF